MHKSGNPFDELAAMFLTGTHGDSVATAPQPVGGITGITDAIAMSESFAKDTSSKRDQLPTIELLIAGHLPVRGNLWLTPYADVRARQSGATALLRLDGPEPSVQLLYGPSVTGNAPVQSGPHNLIADLGLEIELWIIRAPSGWRPEDFLNTNSPIDRITILTSGDEAALVAAYQMIKDFAKLECNLPPIHLSIVGMDEAESGAIVDRLNRTTANFLGVQILQGACLPRMDAGVKSTGYIRLANHQSLAMPEVLQSIHVARQSHRNEPQTNEPIAGRLYAERRKPLGVPPVQTAAPITPPTPRTGASIRLSPKPASLMEAKKASTSEPPVNHTAEIASYVAHVEGLTLLPIRSPGHEKVEIAVESAGRVHLLGNESSLRDMRIVENWIRTNHQLIKMACPQHQIDSTTQPRYHLFAQKPIALADLHGSDVALHVLAPVHVDGQTAWYSAPLNVITS